MSTAGNTRVALLGFGVAVIGMALALVVAMQALATARQRADRLTVVVDSLRADVAAQRDNLRRVRSRARSDSLMIAKLRDGLNDYDIRELKQLGLADPLRDIKSDLMRHPELIPIPGVMGGRMGFYSGDGIRIQDDRCVYAVFDDGHIGGAALLAYAVRNGRIQWTLLSAHRL